MESSQPFTIEALSSENIDEANVMRLQSWLDTYVNEEIGVTREWIEKRNSTQMTDEKRASRLEKLQNLKSTGWVARSHEGQVIGLATPYIDDEGIQHVGPLYVERNWHGKGVGAALMQQIIHWCNPSEPIVLGVVTYNQRAKAFYRKWGFEEVLESESLHDGVLPEVMMTRGPEADAAIHKSIAGQ